MTYLSEDGRFLGHVGKRGRTEPDFDAIQAVIAGPLGEALVWDGASRRLSRLDASRRIRGSTRIDLPRDMPRDFVPRLQVAGRLEVGDLVVGISSTQIGGDSSGHYRYRTELMRYDRSGRIVAPIIMLEGGEYYVYRGGGPILSRDVPFAPQVRWTVGTESIFVTDGRTYSIKEYAPTGNLVRILRLDRQPTIVTPTMIAEYRTSALAAMDPRYRTALLKLLDALHYPERAAAYTSLQLDPEGNLWARHQSLGRGVESWDVFAPNGSLRGTVRMPEGTALVGVTENVVVTRRELSDTVVFGFHGKR